MKSLLKIVDFFITRYDCFFNPWSCNYGRLCS